MATETFYGPIDYLVMGFPPGARVDAGLLALRRRLEQGILEVLDLEIIGRDDAGTPVRLDPSDLAGGDSARLDFFRGAASNILDAADRERIAASLVPGGFALALVYEDRSLADAATAWAAADGVLLWSGGVELDDLEAALDATVAEEVAS